MGIPDWNRRRKNAKGQERKDRHALGVTRKRDEGALFPIVLHSLHEDPALVLSGSDHANSLIFIQYHAKSRHS
jgi:hypothetical protein